MSRIRFQSKLNGRKILSGNWTRAILLTLLVLLPMGGVRLLELGVRKVLDIQEYSGTGLMDMVPNTSASSIIISLIFSVVLFLFITPLQAGQAEWYWRLVDRKETPVGEVFGWYGSLGLYLKSVLLQLHILWRLALWMLVFCAAPGALMAVYWLVLGGANTLLASFLLLVAALLFFCASIGILVIAVRYFPAIYLLVEDSTRKPNDCVRTAVRLSKGFRWEIIKFHLSFILWGLLCYLVFPALYVMPYYNASSAVFARHIIYTQRAKERLRSTEPAEGAIPPETDKE